MKRKHLSISKFMYKVFVQTLGCKVNSFDSKAIENQFKERGCQLTPEANTADITIINTCSVTKNASKETHYLARKFKKANPNVFLVATGCYAQTDSAKIAELDEVDYIVPNEVKDQILPLIYQRLESKKSYKLPPKITSVRDNQQGHFKSALTFFDKCDSEKTRVFLKVQDGCNGFCTYCLIPYARGKSSSVPREAIIAEARRLESIGTKEIVLTGIHIGDYGEDLPSQGGDQPSFAALLEELFSNTSGLRVRISSLEPSEVNTKLLAVLDKYRSRFCDHFHLPLQSGSDKILSRMRRQYSKQTYLNNVEDLRKLFPRACFGADIIPGFPGETQQDFQETIDFIEECQLNYLHVFPYSKRPNTAALKMSGHVRSEWIAQRAKILRELSDKLRDFYYRSFLQTECEVLWNKSTQSKDGLLYGTTKNYLNIVASQNFTTPNYNTVTNSKILGFYGKGALLGAPK